MTKHTFLALLVALTCAFALAMPDAGEAARMGGGRSFGSKPFMNSPAPAPSPRPSGVQNPGVNRQARQAGAAQATRPGGMLGGMGGLFGGLLAGTLLGSLLSGQGFSGGGFLDIIIFGLLIYFGLRLFASFRSRRAAQPAAAGAEGSARGPSFQPDAPLQRDMGATGWDALRDGGGATPSAGPEVSVPPGFDVEEFLRGAKMAYTRLQDSWDRRDMADIAQFATAGVQREVRAQMEADPHPSRTEILLVNARLLGVQEEGGAQYAQVYFDVLLRESPDQTEPSPAREVWHFMRAADGGHWQLDGIQQVQ